jgi:hypothetical protein
MWLIRIDGPNDPPTMQRVIGGLPHGAPKALEVTAAWVDEASNI